jgi:hypothetical protein
MVTLLLKFNKGFRFYCRIWVVGRLKMYDYMTLAAVVDAHFPPCSWYKIVTEAYCIGLALYMDVVCV